MNNLISCGQCGASLNESPFIAAEDRTSCPVCGSLTHNFQETVIEKLTIKEQLRLKHKRPGFKKPIYESISGDDLYRKTGQWNKKEQIIDREHNHYYKKVTNPETGEIIRECDEHLSKHVNRGSAKKIISKVQFYFYGLT